MKPTKIARQGEKLLQVNWSDGTNQELAGELLRRHCPCAECREERGEGEHSRPIRAVGTAAKKSSLRIVEAPLERSCAISKIWAVGNYALGVAFADGHDTGIYPFTLLRSLSK